MEGCEGAHRANGYCGKHYERVRAHGDPHVVLTVGPRKKKNPSVGGFCSRLPAAPLQEVLKGVIARQGLNTLARKMEVKADWLSHIANHNKWVMWETADRICCAMKMHPAELWPHEWTAAA